MAFSIPSQGTSSCLRQTPSTFKEFWLLSNSTSLCTGLSNTCTTVTKPGHALLVFNIEGDLCLGEDLSLLSVME